MAKKYIIKAGVAEIWKPISGYEGLYEISNTGRVRSLSREYTQLYKTGRVGRHKTKERILKERWTTDGYNSCVLYKKDNPVFKSIHRLVAEAFVLNPLNHPQINHKNGKKWDNRVENLEWCDNGFNQRHALRLGLRKNTKRGEDNNLSRLKNTDVQRILMAKEMGIKPTELSNIFGINRVHIWRIFTGRSWKHIKLNII